MKIKSLLLGSAAALVAVSGARAADAVIIPEPEAVEYVRVCDAAGAGYFYIPGSETCLKISGEIIYYMHFNNDGFDGQAQDGWEKEYEISLDFDTWRMTDLGVLTTSIQLGTDVDTGIDTAPPAPLALTDGTVAVNEAFFTLAGLTIGYTDSFYDTGYGAGDFDADGPDTGIVAYKFDLGAATLGLSIENDTDTDWAPAVVVNATGSFGMVDLFGAVVYDDTDSFWGAKGKASYSSGPLSLNAGFQYSENGASAYATAYEWVLGAYVGYAATDALTVYGGVDYGIDEFAAANDDDWLIEIGFDYDITDNLTFNAQADFIEGGWQDAEVSFTASF